MKKRPEYLTAKTAEFIADEATKAHNNRDFEAELNEVLEHIAQQALARRKRTFFHQELLPRTIEKLRELGYEVREPQNEEWEGPRSFRVTWTTSEDEKTGD